MIEIKNDGRLIESTNYWTTTYGQRGLFFMSGNGGAWRLLVPSAAEHMIPEMKTGERVYAERSRMIAGNVDIVFDDRTPAPFSISIDPRMFDRTLHRGRSPFLVYTQKGLEISTKINSKAR